MDVLAKAGDVKLDIIPVVPVCVPVLVLGTIGREEAVVVGFPVVADWWYDKLGDVELT